MIRIQSVLKFRLGEALIPSALLYSSSCIATALHLSKFLKSPASSHKSTSYPARARCLVSSHAWASNRWQRRSLGVKLLLLSLRLLAAAPCTHVLAAVNCRSNMRHVDRLIPWHVKVTHGPTESLQLKLHCRQTSPRLLI